ncbi:unnamed protein product [Miscanthus lutarioriparius]|uniref:Uncharacterized protein n=1 Tax=Miscanthus lutarioriparius TaxID=422564 RepID=A0A811S4R4_9POAL|nr:unnamed protein product [Miscanthus lutarioriparius]
MDAEDSKDVLKNVDWKTVGGAVTTESSKPIVKKRLPKKIRQVPDCYFLPRRSWPSALAIYGALCAAGVGAGMLLEVWINKKIKVYETAVLVASIACALWHAVVEFGEQCHFLLRQ